MTPVEPLADLLARERRLDPARAVGLVAGVAEALDAAHDAGRLHQDVRPGTVLVTPPTGGDPESASLAGVGSAPAPERLADGPIDRHGDVRALGALLHEMLTGRPPFAAADPAAPTLRHRDGTPLRVSSLVAGVPAALDEVVLSALAEGPADRFPTAGALATAARAALAPEREAGPPVGRGTDVVGTVVLVLTGLLALAGGALAIVGLVVTAPRSVLGATLFAGAVVGLVAAVVLAALALVRRRVWLVGWAVALVVALGSGGAGAATALSPGGPVQVAAVSEAAPLAVALPASGGPGCGPGDPEASAPLRAVETRECVLPGTAVRVRYSRWPTAADADGWIAANRAFPSVDGITLWGLAPDDPDAGPFHRFRAGGACYALAAYPGLPYSVGIDAYTCPETSTAFQALTGANAAAGDRAALPLPRDLAVPATFAAARGPGCGPTSAAAGFGQRARESVSCSDGRSVLTYSRWPDPSSVAELGRQWRAAGGEVRPWTDPAGVPRGVWFVNETGDGCLATATYDGRAYTVNVDAPTCDDALTTFTDLALPVL